MTTNRLYNLKLPVKNFENPERALNLSLYLNYT